MAENNILISVIIPSHQRAEKLFKLLDSLEIQSLDHSKYEVIVVPSPEDESIGQFKDSNYKMNVKLVLPNGGENAARNVSAKRNIGAANANGTWFAFTDDDCITSSTWLEEAQKLFSDNIGGIEGKTITPDGSPKTLTFKGLQRLAKPKGYQTCNIFYKKSIYDEIGGFDEVGFPWFLEDTDMAWSVLDIGCEIAFADKVIIYHPVGEAAPWRNYHEAKNSGRKLLLYKKHPVTYLKMKMKIFRYSHYLYLFLILSMVLTYFSNVAGTFMIARALFLLVLGLHSLKLFLGYKFSFSEFFQILFFTIIWPFVAIFAVIKDAYKYRVNPLRLIKLIIP